MEEINICRLCLNLVKNEFEIIDVVTRQMLEVLSLKVDLNASKDPILCRDCAEIIRKSYHFKADCIDTEEHILSFSTTTERCKFDMKDVYENSKGRNVTNKNLNVCRFCMNQIERNSCVSIDILMKDMLAILMPKMVLTIICDPVVCTSCRENLESYFKLMQNCLATEEKINKYRQNEGICNTSRIKLSNVLEFSFKDTSIYPEKYTLIPIIKQESEDFEIKCEQVLDIKNEEGTTETSCKSLSEITVDKYEVGVYEEIDKNNLEIHERHRDEGDTTVEMLKCTICTYETKYKRYLRRHMLIHRDASEVEMYKCEICTYETKNKRYFKCHMVKHKDNSEVEMYKCGICPYETKYRKSFNIHTLKHKNSSEVDMYKCTICTHETKYKNGLRIHMLMHKDTSEVEMHKCTICTYETRYKKNVKYHMLIHKDSSEVEIHKCKQCKYKTKFRNDLKKHRLVHEDIGKVEVHKCGMCTFETKYKSSLKTHMLKQKHTEVVVRKENDGNCEEVCANFQEIDTKHDIE